jgi:carboxyl-terminal processing protease
MQSRRKLIPVLTVLTLAAMALVGGRAVLAAPADDPAGESLRAFTQVFSALEEHFADPVSADKAVFSGAIPGMLRTLDPHSKFFDPVATKDMQEGQSGRYFGVGMGVIPRNGKIVVGAPFGNSPAHRAGIRPGDVIVQVNDKPSTNLSTAEISQLLRGPRGTKVRVQLNREGRDGMPQVLNVELVRDVIPQPTVPLGFFLRPGIAYIKVTSFGERTGLEFEDQFKKLGEKDITGLILDMRGNPGGLLNEGIEVASHFLNRGQAVVSQQGRASPTRKWTAPRDGTGRNYPIVVIVDDGSASAAEIVTGALQDHDRAWVLGQPTYGKGLVQSSFDLSAESVLWLTTAHFYTPSGRLIQRSYSGMSYLDYVSRDRLEQKDLNDVRMTDSGRTVYGGGGITPDEKIEPPVVNRFQFDTKNRNLAFFDFGPHYFAGTDAKLPKNWEPNDALIAQFHDFLRDRQIAFSEAEFTANREWVRQELKRELTLTAFSLEDSQRVAAEYDPEVLKALEALPRANALLETSRKVIAERQRRQPQPIVR